MERNSGNNAADAIRVGAEWRRRDRKSLFWPSQGDRDAPKMMFPLDGVGDGASGQAAVPVPSLFVCTGVTRALNTHPGERVALGRSSICATERGTSSSLPRR